MNTSFLRVSRRSVLIFVVSILTAMPMSTDSASGGLMARRHYYGSWSYHRSRNYYYSSYYYKPSSTYSGYKHHYCIYYTNQPRYVYYYNPVRRVYWGRYDLMAKGYSMLDEKDQKSSLAEIKEEAFPKPASMPAIPESDDGESMLEVDSDALPTADQPEDTPAK